MLIGSADSKRRSKKRVGCDLKIGKSIITHIELVLLKRKWKLRQPITLIKLVHNMEYSHPYTRCNSVMVARSNGDFGKQGSIP